MEATKYPLLKGEILYHYRNAFDEEKYLEDWKEIKVGEDTYYYKYFWLKYEDFRMNFMNQYPKRFTPGGDQIVRLASFTTIQDLSLKKLKPKDDVSETNGNIGQTIADNFNEFDGWISSHDKGDSKTEVLLWTKGDKKKPCLIKEKWNLTAVTEMCGGLPLPQRKWVPHPPGEGDW